MWSELQSVPCVVWQCCLYRDNLGSLCIPGPSGCLLDVDEPHRRMEIMDRAPGLLSLLLEVVKTSQQSRRTKEIGKELRSIYRIQFSPFPTNSEAEQSERGV